MTIELANRLTKLRKEHGYSQEDLADKLGVSRQAVSKWERAEATPDMDNLIELAKIYEISLDEIVGNKIEDKKKEDKVEIVAEESEQKLTVKAGDKVVVKLSDKDDDDDDDDKCKNHKSKTELVGWILTLCAVITYLLLGFLCGLWWNMWILIFIPDIIISTYKAIRDKNLRRFNIVFLVLFTYFFLCMVVPGGIWHPTWVIFFAIPIFYTIASIIHGKKK